MSSTFTVVDVGDDDGVICATKSADDVTEERSCENRFERRQPLR